MNPDNVYLSVSRCSEYVGLSHDNFSYWCRTGYIKAKQKCYEGIWSIKASDFANFLYFNPRCLQHYKTMSLHGLRRELQNAILQDLSARPFVIDSIELRHIFGVHRQTIWNWTKDGIFNPCGYSSNRIPVYEFRDILKGFERAPRLKHRYYEAYEELKKMKGENNVSHKYPYCNGKESSTERSRQHNFQN